MPAVTGRTHESNTRRLDRPVGGGETNYVMATTGVYMSLFNIFANLLSLLMSLAGERD